jgi:hypothetical protein
LNVFQIDKLDAGSITMLWLIYTGVVASSAMASKLISYKYDPSASTGKKTAKFQDEDVVDDDYEGPGRRRSPRSMTVTTRIDSGRVAKQSAIDDPDA